MSDDLFFEGEEPTEEIKKDKPKAKPAAANKGGKGKPAPGKGKRPPGKGAPQGKRPAPAPAPKPAGFEFTPTVVVLVAIITALIGFLLGLFAANWLLPDVNTSPPQQVAPQTGTGGGMGQMGGGMGGEEAPILTDDQMMEGQMPAGHPQIEYDADGNPIMPEGMTEGGAGTLNEDGTAIEEAPADEE